MAKQAKLRITSNLFTFITPSSDLQAIVYPPPIISIQHLFICSVIRKRKLIAGPNIRPALVPMWGCGTTFKFLLKLLHLIRFTTYHIFRLVNIHDFAYLNTASLDTDFSKITPSKPSCQNDSYECAPHSEAHSAR